MCCSWETQVLLIITMWTSWFGQKRWVTTWTYWFGPKRWVTHFVSIINIIAINPLPTWKNVVLCMKESGVITLRKDLSISFVTLSNSLNACQQFRENLRWFWFFKTEQRRDLDSSKHGNNDIDERENQSKWNFKIAKASNTKNLDGNAESFSYSGKNTNWI